MEGQSKYDLYIGADEQEVWTLYFEDSKTSWGFNVLSRRRKYISLDPFNTTCLGIDTGNDYTLKVSVTRVNKVFLGMFIVGTLLFLLAPLLVHEPLCFYIFGVIFGILASLLIVLYFILNLLPLKKSATIGLLAGGSTVIIYCFQAFVNNIYLLAQTHRKIVYGYLIVVGLISLTVCYRFGPITNQRSKNILQWSLQAFSILLVFYSSHNQKLTFLSCLSTMLFYKIPMFKWALFKFPKPITTNHNNAVATQTPSKIVSTKKVYFVSKDEFVQHGIIESRNLEELRLSYLDSFKKTTPPKSFSKKPRFLTKEEFKQQGIKETNMALQDLRQYCLRNPKDVKHLNRSNLKNFTQFVVSGKHDPSNYVRMEIEEISEDDD
ncbi:nuclear envelope integral membrane protein-like [Macrosteles quadrilineatus]|uniref:nuclear envelope integral membrane protein-like n=1 Tax=Macrosteles quadrilineatus TaxID=74068 RepID=UPI0023E2EB6F|nr:nuclear envelope integral membrane protein-like [Macrosteles quadrilineatus]